MAEQQPEKMSDKPGSPPTGSARVEGQAAAAGSETRLPPRVIVHLAPNRAQRLVQWLGWMGFIVCGLLLLSQSAALSDYLDTTDGIRERFHSGNEYGSEKIAIIDVSGVILDGDGYVKNQIERVRNDESVKAIVVRVNSPGGTVTGSDYIFHHLRELREEKQVPMVVSMGSLAASGGYYVSMAVGDQEQSIFAEPTTTTGSIGVMIPHYDLSGLLERIDVKDDSLATHPRKLMLSMTRPMSEDDKEVLEAYMAESFARFKEVIYYGRPALKNDEGKLEKDGKNLATGEIFTAEQAKKYGLVDEIGFLEEAIERVTELAGLDTAEVRVVEFRPPATLLDGLLGGTVRSSRPDSEWQMLLEATTPRAYFLFTSVPPLASFRDR